MPSRLALDVEAVLDGDGHTGQWQARQVRAIGQGCCLDERSLASYQLERADLLINGVDTRQVSAHDLDGRDVAGPHHRSDGSGGQTNSAVPDLGYPDTPTVWHVPINCMGDSI